MCMCNVHVHAGCVCGMCMRYVHAGCVCGMCIYMWYVHFTHLAALCVGQAVPVAPSPPAQVQLFSARVRSQAMDVGTQQERAYARKNMHMSIAISDLQNTANMHIILSESNRRTCCSHAVTR